MSHDGDILMQRDTPREDGVRTFRQRPLRMIGLCLISLVFVGCSLLMIFHPGHGRSITMGVVGAILFGSTLVSTVVSLVKPTAVTIGPMGLTITTAWRSRTAPWAEVSDFRIRQYSLTKMVMFDDASRPQFGLSRMAGAGTFLPGGLDARPEELVRELQSAQRTWLQRGSAPQTRQDRADPGPGTW